jgi:hypothetical protein
VECVEYLLEVVKKVDQEDSGKLSFQTLPRKSQGAFHGLTRVLCIVYTSEKVRTLELFRISWFLVNLL